MNVGLKSNTADKVRFTQDTAADNVNEEDDDDYSASVNAIMRKRSSSRRRKRRSSSPFSPEDLSAQSSPRRKSSGCTSTSADSTQSVEEDGVKEEKIFENIRLHKEVIANVKLQPWPIRRKLKLLRQAKAYVKRHEGELQVRLKHSRSTKDILKRFNIVIIKKWQHMKREVANFMNLLIPWELRIKEIESHFGSVVASYFIFLRWLFWVNLVTSIVFAAFVIIPQILLNKHRPEVERKELMETAGNVTLDSLLNFEGPLKHSPIFYGYYTNRETNGKYKIPVAYFLVGIGVYIYSFVATLRKMAVNFRLNKLSEKEDECIFTWKLFTGWDYMIGNAETGHNRTSSIVLGFKEALLEEAEKMKEKRSWKIISIRIFVNINFLWMLMLSAGTVVTVVNKKSHDQINEKESFIMKWWHQNEITVVMTVIENVFPQVFELFGFIERYHPRKQLRIQLGRIMALNLLNLYTLTFALFGQIEEITDELEKIQGNITNQTINKICNQSSNFHMSIPVAQRLIMFTDEIPISVYNHDPLFTESYIRDKMNSIQNNTNDKSYCYYIPVNCSEYGFSNVTNLNDTRISEHDQNFTIGLKPKHYVHEIFADNAKPYFGFYYLNDDVENTQDTTMESVESYASTTEKYDDQESKTETIDITKTNTTTAYHEIDIQAPQIVITSNKCFKEVCSNFKYITTDLYDQVLSEHPTHNDVEMTTRFISTDTTQLTNEEDKINQFLISENTLQYTFSSSSSNSTENEETTEQTISDRNLTTVLPDETINTNQYADNVSNSSYDTSVIYTMPLSTLRTNNIVTSSINTNQYVDDATNSSYDISMIYTVQISTSNDNTATSSSISYAELDENVTALNDNVTALNEFISKGTDVAVNNVTDFQSSTIKLITDVFENSYPTISINRSSKTLDNSSAIIDNTISSVTLLFFDDKNTTAYPNYTALNTTDKEMLWYLNKTSFNITTNFQYSSNNFTTHSTWIVSKNITNATDLDDIVEITTLSTTETTVTKDYLSSKIRCIDTQTKQKLQRLCWETMFGQELVKLTVMDLVSGIVSTFFMDFIRSLLVRYMNRFWCWDLEKKFPKYGDFKIAENILHLVNNQGLVWMGMFFSPGLPLINVGKLMILMYLRSWAVLTCNVPHEVVFRVTRSNNFYLALLLMMLFLCVIPVCCAIVWLKPSWHCGPFSDHEHIYLIFTTSLKKYTPPSLHTMMDYIASPGTVIPLIMILLLIIYYLASLTSALREANADLKIQLRRERTEERKKVFQMASRRKRGGSDMDSTFVKWKQILQEVPSPKQSIDDGGPKTNGTSETQPTLPDEEKQKIKKLFRMKHRTESTAEKKWGALMKTVPTKKEVIDPTKDEEYSASSISDKENTSNRSEVIPEIKISRAQTLERIMQFTRKIKDETSKPETNIIKEASMEDTDVSTVIEIADSDIESSGTDTDNSVLDVDPEDDVFVETAENIPEIPDLDSISNRIKRRLRKVMSMGSSSEMQVFAADSNSKKLIPCSAQTVKYINEQHSKIETKECESQDDSEINRAYPEGKLGKIQQLKHIERTGTSSSLNTERDRRWKNIRPQRNSSGGSPTVHSLKKK